MTEARALLDQMRQATTAYQLWAIETTHDALSKFARLTDECERLRTENAQLLRRLEGGDAEKLVALSRERAQLEAECERLRQALDLQQRKEQHENRVLELRQRAEAAEAECERLRVQRDKWLDAFNRSEQFQSGPTKRAEKAEAECERLREALELVARLEPFKRSPHWGEPLARELQEIAKVALRSTPQG